MSLINSKQIKFPLSGSFSGSLEGTASYATSIVGGKTGFIPFWNTDSTLSNSLFFTTESFNSVYLFTDSSNPILGTTNSTGSVTISVGGEDPTIYSKLILNANNQHSLTGSLDITGSVSTYELIIKDPLTQQPVLTINQDNITFTTHSSDPSGSTNAGSIWFTSSSFYVGLE